MPAPAIADAGFSKWPALLRTKPIPPTSSKSVPCVRRVITKTQFALFVDRVAEHLEAMHGYILSLQRLTIVSARAFVRRLTLASADWKQYPFPILRTGEFPQ
jgi:hypothetical protein